LNINDVENNLINSDLKINDDDSESSINNEKNINNKKSKISETIVLCGVSLKKKGEICKNKVSPGCNGKCKRHHFIII